MTTLFNKLRQVLNPKGHNASEAGLTIIELVVFVGIGSVIILVLVMMTTSAFNISRRELEQGAITEKARREIEKMSDEIRNAQYIDCNVDGDTADPNEHWLIAGDAYSITLYSNIDSDVEAEKIRYFVEASENKKLKRGITQSSGSLCNFSGTEEVQVVLDGLNNMPNNTPLFYYYTGGDDATELVVPVITLSSVLRVGLDLQIEESDVNSDEIKIATDVVPRSVENPPACVDSEITAQRYQYTSSTTDFADAAYNYCQNNCNSAGSCCGWSTSFSWQGNLNWYVWASCQCENTYLPPDLTPESVPVGGYTTFAKACLEGTKCGGQMGEPICNAGCLTGPGDCVCVCPAGWDTTTACNDGFDNDNDGVVDYAGGTGDPGCSSASDSSENSTDVCDDGQDNDNDTFTDFQLWGGDPECLSPTDTVECGPAEIWGVPQCSDGMDNECAGDGVDFGNPAPPADPQCADDLDNNEWSSSVQCDDGLDNDGDGTIDWNGGPGGEPADTDCNSDNLDESEFSATGSPEPPGPVYQCSDDFDNDSNSATDWNGGSGGDPADTDGCIDYFDDDESSGPSDPPPVCGDGLVNGTEVCDSSASPDGCNVDEECAADCTACNALPSDPP